ncbi:MAG TPA: TlpA disulfide reductase family protein [Alphaproteobacteria bacterium]|nr:TlpA disulfide reductase family protein [Alphaproteobacteria bacterium]
MRDVNDGGSAMKRFFRRRVLVGGSVGAAVIAAILLATGWWRTPAPGLPEFRGAIGPFVTHAAPAPVPPLAFADATGRSVSLDDFKGKLVLLNLWATWCGPCVEEMPSLDRLQAKLGSADFAVLALAMDKQGRALVEPFLAKLGVTNLPMYLDPSGAAIRALKARGLPTTLLIDREGREIGRLEGAAAWDSEAAAAFLRFHRDGGSKRS